MQLMSRCMVVTLVLFILIVTGVASAGNTTFPVPVQTVSPPANLSIGVQVDQDGTEITASFRGGLGQMLVKEIVIEHVMSDGTNETLTLMNTVGDSVTFVGSGCGDQIIGTAYYKNGQAYTFLNVMTDHVVGLCADDYYEVTDPCAEIAASLKTDPVDDIPKKKSVIIQANVDIKDIIVELRGGAGQGLIKEITVTRIAPDGTADKQILGKSVGDSVTFVASNNCLERITADVSFMDGTKYHVLDQILHISRPAR